MLREAGGQAGRLFIASAGPTSIRKAAMEELGWSGDRSRQGKVARASEEGSETSVEQGLARAQDQHCGCCQRTVDGEEEE